MPLKSQVLDAYHPEGDTPVELHRIPGGTHAYKFPDGTVEYVKDANDFREEMNWRYGLK
jgi:hypothetical protein